MKKIFLIGALLLLCFTASKGQYFQYSLYEYAPYRYNPARRAVENASVIEAVFRNQKTAGGFDIQSSSISLSQPIWMKGNAKLGTLGLSLLDDRSGAMGYFRNNELAAAFSKSVKLNESQSLNVGVKASYHSRRISTEDFYTASQYVSYRGFDPSLPSGESLAALNTDFWSTSLGAMWFKGKPNRMGNSYVGVSFFDIAKGSVELGEDASASSRTFTTSGGWAINAWRRAALTPEILFTYSQQNMNASFGPLLQLGVGRSPEREFVGLSLKYITTGEISSSFSLTKSNFQWSAGFEIGLNQYNPAHQGAFELGLRYQFLERKIKSSSKSKKVKPKEPNSRDINIKPEKNLIRDTSKKEVEKDTLQTTLLASDSLNQFSTSSAKKGESTAEVTTGPISQMLIYPDTVYHLRFESDRHHVDGPSLEILESVLTILDQSEDSKIIIIGHTDEVGTENYNLKLSYKRAETVKKLLVDAGLPEERIIVEGKGSSEPISPNHHHEGRALNRRVDIRIEL